MTINPQEPIVDLSDLAEMRSMDATLLNSIIDQYLSDVPLHLQLLQEAVAQKNAEGIRQEAHFFRGSSANFKATYFSVLCAHIETQSRAGNLRQIDSLMKQFILELKRVQAALAAAKEPISVEIKS